MPTAILRPNGIGTQGNNWAAVGTYTDKWDCVDPGDPVNHDDDTSYLENADTHSKQSVTFEDLPVDADAVLEVKLGFRPKNPDSQTNSFEYWLHLSGTDGTAESGSRAGGTGYSTEGPAKQLRPGGGIWEVVDVNALEGVWWNTTDPITVATRETSVWLEVDYTTTATRVEPHREIPSRRLRLLRFPVPKLSLISRLDLFDTPLLDDMLVSDPHGPESEGTGWSNEDATKARLVRVLSQTLSLSSKAVSMRTLDLRQYLCTFWDVGKSLLVNTESELQGIAKLDPGAEQTFARNSYAWVEQVNGMLVEIPVNQQKRTSTGWLFEIGNQNLIQNNAFLDGLTGWNTVNPLSVQLDTSAEYQLLHPGIVDRLGGTRQVVHALVTLAGSASGIYRTASSASPADAPVYVSIYHRENSYSTAPTYAVQNTVTGNWWHRDTQDWQAAQFRYRLSDVDSSKMVRSVERIVMESTAGPLLVKVLSEGAYGVENWIGHVQVENYNPTSPKISRNGVNYTGVRDDNYYNNDAGNRIMEWYKQGMFRCVYIPKFNAVWLDDPDDYVALFDCVDSSDTQMLGLFYINDGGTRKFRLATAWNATGAEITHDVVRDTEYKVVVRWIGAKGELDESEGTLILDVYDPVAESWSQADYAATLAAEKTYSDFYLGCDVRQATAHGEFRAIEVKPFVFPTAEARAFP